MLESCPDANRMRDSMDATRFDGFARAVATRLARRTGLGLIAGSSLPLLGLVTTTDAKKKKITLCFNGQTVKKPKKKAKKLLKKGATKGACGNGGCPGGQKACGSGCIPLTDCCVNTDCTGDDVCENGACVPLRCGNGGACTVFMTAAGFTGSQINGLAGGDAACQAAAATAGLAGTFKAWLSAGNDTPGTRFDNVNEAGPYLLVANAAFDGGNPPPTVAENFADLFSCGGGDCLNNAINRDENGQVLGGIPSVWTGTLANGNASVDTCSGWTSTATNGLLGSGTSTTTAWTENVSFDCTSPNVIYCFQQAT
jgi:hypothetical protein